MATFENGVLRDRPRINVLRGYPGNEPTSITAALPVDSGVDHSSIAKTILSGQPIFRNGSGNFTNGLGSGWGDTKGTDAKNVQDIFFAYHDSTDTDVTSCGKLLGFSALGKFELETAWFDDTAAISVGDALGINDAGLLRQLDESNADGSGPVVGYCTGIRDLGIGGHTAANARGGVAGTIPEDSTASAYTPTGGNAGNWVITFVTSVA